MEIKRKCGLEKLSKQPLAYVLIQIRFSPISLLENYIDKIQAALNKVGFPLVERNENLSVNVMPTGINTQKWLQWTFKSVDQRTNIVFDKNQISFQTTDYSIFEDFYKNFSSVFSTVFGLIPDFITSNKIQRLGLRYIDQIIPQTKNDTVSSYIKTDYTVFPIFGNQQRMKSVAQSGEITIENDITGFITVKLSEGKNGTPIPPELMARAPALVRNEQKEIDTGIIDVDHSYMPKVPEDYDENRLKLLFYRMHDNTNNVFKQIVSEEGMQKWK